MNCFRIIGAILLLAATADAFTPVAHHHHRSFHPLVPSSLVSTTRHFVASTAADTIVQQQDDSSALVDDIDSSNPLRVVIAGAGVGGLCLASVLRDNPNIQVTVLERTDEFKRFGGPIQLASNALEILKNSDPTVFTQVMNKFTTTGDKINGIKDGIRDEWYAKFDLKSPAESRNMPYTGVIERPDLQEIYLKTLTPGTVKNGDGVMSYQQHENGSVTVVTQSGQTYAADVLIGADGIWSNVRATMREEPSKGEESGAKYSGYTLFAGELKYDSFDHGQVGYKVYIGPNQYFVVTDIGNGRYQWYAFLGREPGSAETEEKPEGTSKYLQDLFTGWSKDIHHILQATQEHEIEQRDLYDRAPSLMKPWTDKHVALLGDSIHAMMPNLGQGGCQAIEDAYVLAQELESAKKRSQVEDLLMEYRRRRFIRSASVQGLSRFASDIIIKGFDTPAKIVRDEKTGEIRFENFNYAGVMTKLLQPILPLFFKVQFNFLYEGWRNEMIIDLKAALGLGLLGGVILLVGALALEEAGLGLYGLVEVATGGEALEAAMLSIREFFSFM